MTTSDDKMQKLVEVKNASISIDEQTLLDVFNGVPRFEVAKADIIGTPAIELLTSDAAKVFPSKGEMRKMVQGGGVSINKEKLASYDAVINADSLLNGKYILAQRGKKNYFLIVAK